VEACAEDADGCLAWEVGETCGALQRCDAAARVCDDDCDAAGDTQCRGDTIQTCTTDTDGCLGWTDGTDCSAEDPPQTCGESIEGAVCGPDCDDACPAAGDTRCSADVVQTCTAGADGCFGIGSGGTGAAPAETNFVE
jgi:hypothetical protein